MISKSGENSVKLKFVLHNQVVCGSGNIKGGLWRGGERADSANAGDGDGA